MVSANLSQLTPFERYRLQLYLNISNSYMIQIYTGFKFIYIHSNNSQILYNIQITHFHIVENSKLHQLFIEQIFHNYKVEETP
jgi:hypothetical protein